MQKFSKKYLIIHILITILYNLEEKPTVKTIQGRDCQSECKKQGNGLFMCTSDLDELEECFNPIQLEHIKESAQIERDALAGKIVQITDQVGALNGNKDALEGEIKVIHEKLDNYINDVDQIEQTEAKIRGDIKDLYQFNSEIYSLKKSIGNYLDNIELRKSAMKKEDYISHDCQNKPGYKSSIEGDGLVGHQQDNEMFQKDQHERIDHRIDFMWSDEAPVPQRINPHNFSVRWKGFFKPPSSGKWKFRLDTDDSGILIVNGSTVVQYNLDDRPFTDWLMFHRRAMNKFVKRNEYKRQLNVYEKLPKKEQTDWMQLEAHQFQAIEILFVHTVHNSNNEEPVAWAKLKWLSDEVSEQIVPRYQLQSEIRQELIRLSNIDNERQSVDQVEESGEAFIDSIFWRVQDVPYELNNSLRLKSFTEFRSSEVLFESNIPITIQFAVDINESNILDSYWLKTNHQMSLLLLDLENQNELIGKGNGKAMQQVDMQLFKRNFDAGRIKFKVNVPRDSFIYSQIFIIQNMSSVDQSCGGQVFNLTKKFYSSCNASSQLPGYECDKGITGHLVDEKGHMFKLDNESKGGQVEIMFNSMVKPTKITVMQPKDFVEMVKSLKVHQNQYINESISLRDINSEQTRPLVNSQFTNSIRLEFEKVQGSRNNGLAFQIQGQECLDPQAAAIADDKKFEEEFMNPVVFADCDSTLVSLKKDTSPGQAQNIVCQDGCQWEADYSFQGYKVQGVNSALCRTALQEEIIDPDGGMFKVEVSAGNREQMEGPFKFESCNPEHSQEQPASIQIYSFANDTSLSNISQREGQDLEVKMLQDVCWHRGVLKSIKQGGDVVLEVDVPGINETLKVNQPSEEQSFRLAHCGSNIEGECKHGQLKGDDIESLKEAISKRVNVDVKKSQQFKHLAPCGSLRGGDCANNPINCLFDLGELKDIHPNDMCQGDQVLIPLDKNLKEQCKNLRCMQKCIKIKFSIEDECMTLCPQKTCMQQDGFQQCRSQ